MAESVDALVSNTSGATRAGSTPALGTSSTSEAGLNEKQGAVRQQLTALFISPHTNFSPHFPHRCNFEWRNLKFYMYIWRKKIRSIWCFMQQWHCCLWWHVVICCSVRAMPLPKTLHRQYACADGQQYSLPPLHCATSGTCRHISSPLPMIWSVHHCGHNVAKRIAAYKANW